MSMGPAVGRGGAGCLPWLPAFWPDPLPPHASNQHGVLLLGWAGHCMRLAASGKVCSGHGASTPSLAHARPRGIISWRGKGLTRGEARLPRTAALQQGKPGRHSFDCIWWHDSICKYVPKTSTDKDVMLVVMRSTGTQGGGACDGRRQSAASAARRTAHQPPAAGKVPAAPAALTLRAPRACCGSPAHALLSGPRAGSPPSLGQSRQCWPAAGRSHCRPWCR